MQWCHIGVGLSHSVSSVQFAVLFKPYIGKVNSSFLYLVNWFYLYGSHHL